QGASIPGAGAQQSPMRADPPPRLRQTLDILPAESEPDGSPAWLVHDPLANRYFRVSAEALDLMALVDGRSIEVIIAAAWKDYRRKVDAEDVAALFEFLRGHDLVEADAAQIGRYQA